MISPELELARLRGRGPTEAVPAGAELDSVILASSPPGPDVALARCQAVMEPILEHQAGAWPDLDEWKSLLPAWFVEACVDDRYIQTCVVDRWSLRAWLHWVRPENRRWYWWDAEVEPPDGLKVTVLVRERPYLRGALDWLLKAASDTPVS